MTHITFRLSDRVRAQLQEIADAKGVPLEQVLVDAVSLEVTAADAAKSGGRLLVEKAGELRELSPA